MKFTHTNNNFSRKGGNFMNKKIAWDTFKQTGSINSYLEFKELKNIEETIKETLDETSKSKWNSNIRK